MTHEKNLTRIAFAFALAPRSTNNVVFVKIHNFTDQVVCFFRKSIPDHKQWGYHCLAVRLPIWFVRKILALLHHVLLYIHYLPWYSNDRIQMVLLFKPYEVCDPC